MPLIGLGSDIVEIARIAAVIARSGDRLARRILTPSEWLDYPANSAAARFLAKRFAAKEAAAKALGTGFRNGIAFNQFELFHDALGKPMLRLYRNAAALSCQKKVTQLHITIADERHYVVATVIAE